ncbi:MAG: D-alanyl-D-alanine carboxypeptidase family protein, partial [Cyclobacteriaceae bacterium]|nr:D-alanyl-D-alanine carboxypeptidase family protein [Cyclobacteriaceae bacterium]
KPHFENKGLLHRAILGIGLQDVPISGLKPRLNIEIIGGSSDHIIVDTKEKNIKVGTELHFDLNYSSLLMAMTSPYVTKRDENTMDALEYCEKVEQNDQELKMLWPSTPIIENNSPLISLKDVGFNLIFEPSIKKDYKYLVREEIVEKVGRISKSLDELDKRLIIRSAWRSFDHQKMLWDNKVKFLTRVHPEKSNEEIYQLVEHYIAPTDKSMHSTGGAVDGLIYDLKTDSVMDFGTNKGLDIDLNEKCFPYHPDISATATANRKLLIDLFEKEEFLCDNKEYWHFDYGNAVWAAKLGKEYAFYSIVKRLGE